MHRTAVLLVAVGVALSLSATPAPRQWALVVGIDDYIHFDADNGDLRGAESDALRMRHALETSLAVPPENILTLLGRDATKAAIASAFTQWLPERVGPEDRVFIYYAGHGSQVFDVSGDEDDGLDEAICPVDALPSTTDLDILDDEVQAWLERLPARRTIVVLDSCHSGTATRFSGSYARSRKLVRAGDPAVEPMDVEDGLDREGLPGLIEIAAANPGQPAMEIELSSDDQTASQYGGVFTSKLVEQIASLPPSASLEDLYWATYHAVKAEGFAQDPFLSGPADDADLRAVAPASAALPDGPDYVVGQGQGAGVSLSGPAPLASGSVMVTETGSWLTVTRSTDGGGIATPLGSLPRPGQAARLAGLRLPDTTLRVGLERERPVPDRFAGALAAIADVEVTTEAGPEVSLTLVSAASGDSVYLVSREQSIRYAAAAAATDEAIQRLVEVVQRARNARALRVLKNPVQPFGIGVLAASSGPQLRIDDLVDVGVSSERSGYLTLVDHSTDGTLTILYPNQHSGIVYIEGGSTVVLPEEGSGLEIRAFYPLGRAHLLALVTDEPLTPTRFDDQGFARLEGANDLFELLAQTAPLVTLPQEHRTRPGAYVAFDGWNAAIMTYEVVSAAPN